MISKTQINKRLRKKTNIYLIRIIEIAKKNNNIELAKKLSGPTRKQFRINLNELDDIKENKILVVGKVLGSGEIKNKKEISALGFSEQAREKLKKAGCEIKTIKQELEKNPKLTGVKII